jgi:hypothetical protein
VFVQPEVATVCTLLTNLFIVGLNAVNPKDIDWLFHHTAAAAALVMNGAETHS